jgi:hypothetical protein
MNKYEYKIDVSPTGLGCWYILRRQRTPGWFGPKQWQKIGLELHLAEAERFLQQVKRNDEKYG